jgi:hypothetical protein
VEGGNTDEDVVVDLWVSIESLTCTLGRSGGKWKEACVDALSGAIQLSRAVLVCHNVRIRMSMDTEKKTNDLPSRPHSTDSVQFSGLRVARIPRKR